MSRQALLRAALAERLEDLETRNGGPPAAEPETDDWREWSHLQAALKLLDGLRISPGVVQIDDQ